MRDDLTQIEINRPKSWLFEEAKWKSVQQAENELEKFAAIETRRGHAIYFNRKAFFQRFLSFRRFRLRHK